MDDYIVRLGAPRGPTTVEGIRALSSSSSSPPTRRRRKRRKWPFVVAALAVAVALNPGWLDRLASEAKKPVRSLNGEKELRLATEAFTAQWAEGRVYDTDEAALEGVAPGVHWGETIRPRSCFDGMGVVIVASTIRGDVSRLLVQGDKVGDVNGSEDCPAGPHDVSPWVK